MRKLGCESASQGRHWGWGRGEGKQRPGVGGVCSGILTWRWYLRPLGWREAPGQGVDRKDIQALGLGSPGLERRHWGLVGSGEEPVRGRVARCQPAKCDEVRGSTMGLGDVCRSSVTLQRGVLLPWQHEACLGGSKGIG